MAPRDFDNQDKVKYSGSGRPRGNSVDSTGSNEPETIDDDDLPYAIGGSSNTAESLQSQMHYAERDSSPLKRSREDVGPITIDSLEIKKQYDVLDSTNRWCEAEVLKIDREGGRAFVTYLYWSNKFDEWVSDIEGRFAPLRAHTFYEGGVLKVGQRIEVLDEQQKWLEAYVIEENDTQVKIHFKGFHPKFDEWIDRSCKERIRPFGRFNFVFFRKKNAVQWSARPHVLPMNPGSSTQHSYELITGYGGDDKENIPMEDIVREELNNNRVRYIGNETRQRKITNNSNEFLHYQATLQRQQLELIPVAGDGNCLFRAVAHQVYGDEEQHGLVRQKCMDYMESEADFFSQFVVGGKDTFHLYLQAKRMHGCWGDDPEIEAMCEIYNRPAEIWAYDTNLGAKKLRTFHETVGMMNLRRSAGSSSSSSAAASSSTSMIMRLSYYGGGHYDSIVESRFVHSFASSPFVSKHPGEIEDAAIQRSRNRWMMAHSQLSVESVRQLTDVAATEQAALDMALQDSRRIQMDTEYDDLETTLMLSIQDFNASAVGNAKQSSTGLRSPNRSNSNGNGNNNTTVNANEIARLAAQDNILESVQLQSENEYLESVLLNSLVNESKQEATSHEDEELLLQQAILQSQLESQRSQQGHTAGNAVADKDMEIALNLSNLSPEEALELALQQSIAESSKSAAPSRSTVDPTVPVPPLVSSVTSPLQPSGNINGNMNTNPTANMTEEQMLQLALAASLQSVSNGNTNQQQQQANLGYFMDEEYDEDLMLAIQASLGR